MLAFMAYAQFGYFLFQSRLQVSQIYEKLRENVLDDSLNTSYDN